MSSIVCWVEDPLSRSAGAVPGRGAAGARPDPCCARDCLIRCCAAGACGNGSFAVSLLFGCSSAGAASGQKSANCEGPSVGAIRRSVRRRSRSVRCAAHAQRTTSLVRGGPRPNGGKRAPQKEHRRVSYSSSTGFFCDGCAGCSWSMGIDCIGTIPAVSAVVGFIVCYAAVGACKPIVVAEPAAIIVASLGACAL